MTELKSIRMAGQTVKLRRKDLSDHDEWGYWVAEKRMIVVHTPLTPKKFKETLRHEMVHAAWHFCGVTWCEGHEEEALNRCLDEVFWPSWERVERRLGDD